MKVACVGKVEKAGKVVKVEGGLEWKFQRVLVFVEVVVAVEVEVEVVVVVML